MSILNLFDIGRTSLITTRRALDATAHNVANASTDGYNRQEVTLSSIPGSDYSSIGSIGRGVTISAVQRMYDSFTSLQLLTEKSNLSYWQTYQSGVTKIENTFNEASDTGIYPAIADFFNAWQEVSQDPSAYAQRTSLLSKANDLALRINRASTSMYDTRQDIYKSSQLLVDDANTALQKIAILNEQIASNPGALDLRDQRDQLLEQVNEIIKVNIINDSNGRSTVLIGGTPLVDGGTVYKLSTSLDSDGKMHFAIDLPSDTRDITNLVAGGQLKANLDVRDTLIPNLTDKLNVFAIDLADQVNYYHRAGYALDGTSGNDFFNTLVSKSASATNTGTGSISSVTVQSANSAMYDNYTITLTAVNGTDETYQIVDTVTGAVSSVSTTSTAEPVSRELSFGGLKVKIDGTVDVGDSFSLRLDSDAARDLTVAINDPAKVAAASGSYVVVSSNNNIVRFSEDGGKTFTTASLPTGTYTRQQLADLLQTALTKAGSGAEGYTVVFNGSPDNTYSIAKTSSDTVVIDWASTTSTAKGLFGFTASTTLNGAATATSAVSVLPNLPNDNGNAMILYDLFNQSFVAGSKPADYYETIVSDVGVKAQSAKTNVTAQSTLVDQLEQRRQEISGVNLDEEAANLIKFQKSYEAAAKMISIADDLLTALLNMTGRQLA
jgi:flagellar hook-associated protein 1 FlgK